MLDTLIVSYIYIYIFYIIYTKPKPITLPSSAPATPSPKIPTCGCAVSCKKRHKARMTCATSSTPLGGSLPVLSGDKTMGSHENFRCLANYETHDGSFKVWSYGFDNCFFMMCRALAHTNYIYIFLHRHPEDTHTYTMILGDQRFEDLFATPKQDENWIYKWW